MIVTALKDIIGTERDVSGPGWQSRRLLLASDRMGFSMTDTIIRLGMTLELEYKHHLEACYCIEGSGEIKKAGSNEWHPLEPFSLYALNQNDRHEVRAIDNDMRLICVFNPALSGQEQHRPDGSYAPPDP
ncbi:ectoine synthase [Ruegeria sp. Ofav3-42]|uniref:ectoine synthase n=1 Tax=Ruegeria sp. Ofav3-42 TaxID=2917759 RepID=UPI001EF515EC|nr:ectoine synthase [Ruegeria sp. Ofav3-42]MCG7521968.1 ectoine synthase [Ruegeria sp. Ofav3-42]